MELSLSSAAGFLLGQLTLSNSLLFLAVFLLVADYFKRRRPKNFPPGPFSWPLLGNLAQLDFKRLHFAMSKLAEKYGDIFSVQFGSMTIVVLNGLQMVKEAFVHQGDNFDGRPRFPIIYEMFKDFGITSSHGHIWKQQRRFALLTLRNFGMGKRSLEERISEEIRYLTEAMEEEKGQPFNPHFLINKSVSNVICAISFGSRFDYQDAQFQDLLHLLDETLKLQVSISCQALNAFISTFSTSICMLPQLYNAFPQIMKFVPGSHRKVIKNWKTIKSFITKTVQKHKEQWDPSEPRDFIDCYLTEIEKFKGEADSSFHEDNLIHSTVDLFLAGSETTTITMRWALVFMAKYTDIQAKVQVEIDRVIGNAKQPSTENRKDMPYTNAVIHEVQRISNIAPFGVPRCTTSDTVIRGFNVPKGTTIIADLTSVLFDKNEWETPNTFNPEHFLENGKFKQREAFLPFSIGKRACLGEQLAKMELFLYFTTLLQRFTFTAPKDVKLNVSEFIFGSTLSPLPYKICAIAR